MFGEFRSIVRSLQGCDSEFPRKVAHSNNDFSEILGPVELHRFVAWQADGRNARITRGRIRDLYEGRVDVILGSFVVEGIPLVVIVLPKLPAL